MARYTDEEEDLDTAPVDDSGMPDSTKSKAALLKDARINPKESFAKDNIPEGYMVGGMSTADFRDANNNGLEDRGEGIYLGRDLEPKPSNYGVPPTGGMSGPSGPTGVAGASGDFNPDSPYSNAAAAAAAKSPPEIGSPTRGSVFNPPSAQSDEFYFAAAGADTPPTPSDPVGAVSPQPAVAPAAPAQNFFDYLPDKDERGFSALPEAKTYDQATERVSFFEQTGQDMKALVARQDPLFKDAFARQAQTGKSTSPLMLGGQPSGGIERRRASREEREADRTKDPAVARALRASAAQRRASQPSIRTPQDKRQEMERGMQKRDVLQDTLEMGQQAAGGAVAKESTLGTSDGKGLSNGYRLETTAKGGLGASAHVGGGKTEDKKKTGALAYRDDDKLLGMSGGTSTYQYTRLAPLQIMLQDLKSRRA